MGTKYLLIDYENVQPEDLSQLNGEQYKVIVFLGANQTKVPTRFATALQALGGHAEYVQASAAGKNAVDFHIAFTMGERLGLDPDASFHIISKDKGFDPLLAHLRANGRVARRSKGLNALPSLKKAASPKTQEEKIEAIVCNLTARTAGRPGRVTKLANTIRALLRSEVEEGEVETLIATLQARGHLSVENEAVSYHLSHQP